MSYAWQVAAFVAPYVLAGMALVVLAAWSWMRFPPRLGLARGPEGLRFVHWRRVDGVLQCRYGGCLYAVQPASKNEEALVMGRGRSWRLRYFVVVESGMYELPAATWLGGPEAILRRVEDECVIEGELQQESVAELARRLGLNADALRSMVIELMANVRGLDAARYNARTWRRMLSEHLGQVGAAGAAFALLGGIVVIDLMQNPAMARALTSDRADWILSLALVAAVVLATWRPR